MNQLIFALALVAAGACIPPPPPDNPIPDAECPDFLPPPSNPCLEGQCGNSAGVGQPCTKGGGECDVFDLLAGEAGVCTVDFSDNTDVHICSRLCDVDEDCGEGAICFENPDSPGQFGCVTKGCEGL